jgi:hypothetical protein
MRLIWIRPTTKYIKDLGVTIVVRRTGKTGDEWRNRTRPNRDGGKWSVLGAALKLVPFWPNIFFLLLSFSFLIK